MGAQFIKELRNEDALEEFRNAHWASPQQIFENKERIQYTRMEYERLFLQLESDLGKKTLYIFGSGLWLVNSSPNFLINIRSEICLIIRTKSGGQWWME